MDNDFFNQRIQKFGGQFRWIDALFHQGNPFFCVCGVLAFSGDSGLKPLNLFVEVGLGCDLYLPFFKLIPELKFCFGLSNILQKNRNDLTDRNLLIFTESVDKATANMVVLSFYFE